MANFATMRKTPMRLSPHRGVVVQKNQREIKAAISLNESEKSRVTLSRTKWLRIRRPLLSIRPSASSQKLTLGLAVSGGQDRKKTFPVYTGRANG